jgi:hypothetical protein
MTPTRKNLTERMGICENKLLRIEGEIFVIITLIIGSNVVFG